MPSSFDQLPFTRCAIFLSKIHFSFFARVLKGGFEDTNFKTLYDFRSRFANFFERKWNRDIQGKERICVEPLAKEFQSDYKEFKQVKKEIKSCPVISYGFDSLSLNVRSSRVY